MWQSFYLHSLCQHIVQIVFLNNIYQPHMYRIPFSWNKKRNIPFLRQINQNRSKTKFVENNFSTLFFFVKGFLIRFLFLFKSSNRSFVLKLLRCFGLWPAFGFLAQGPVFLSVARFTRVVILNSRAGGSRERF